MKSTKAKQITPLSDVVPASPTIVTLDQQLLDDV
jgi:hypothetical protein